MNAQESCPRCNARLPRGLVSGLCPRCLARTVSASVLPGARTRRLGDYELLEEIGRGGMGVIYRAHQVSLNRTVAVKMILGANLAGAEAVERFHTEAEAAAHLDHPNIVAIHEVGAFDGQPYFSMQWINGQSLDEWISKRDAPLGNRRAAELLAKIARAVHHAHQRGILHRDIKPANILIDEAGEPHVSDFGLARRMTAQNHITMAGGVFGSPAFMAPEQAAGKAEQLTTSVDVYSLGALLYFLLTRHPPFSQPTALDTLRCVLEKEPARPTACNTKVDRDLETICLKCLEKDPSRRYTSADALADDLERWLRQEPIRARPVTTVELLAKWTRRNPVTGALLGLVVLTAAAGFAAVLWEWRQTEKAHRMTQRAQQDGVEKLYASYLAQAQATRWSGRPGRRFDSLAALGKAAEIRPSLELRNEAIAALALPDVRVRRRLSPMPPIANGGLAFNSTMEQYARAAPDGSIRILQLADDRELFRLAGPEKPAWASLFFSPDGRYLAERYTGPATNQVRVWDLSRREQMFSVLMTAEPLSFAPDSRQLAAAEPGGCIHIFDLSLGREATTLNLPPTINAVAFAPSGKSLAVSREQRPTVLIINLETRLTEKTLEHPASVGVIAWSRDGTLLACPCADGRTYVRTMSSEDSETILEGHTGVVKASAFNQPSDLLVTLGWDGMTRFWDPRLSRHLLDMRGGWVPIAFGSDDRQLGFGRSESEAGIWEVEPARECRRLGRADLVWGGQFSPDNRLLAVGSSDGIRIWEVEANRLLAHLRMPDCRSIQWSPCGTNLMVSGLSGLCQWPLRYAEPAGELVVGELSLLSSISLEGSCLLPDGHTLIAAARSGSDLVVFDLEHPGDPKSVFGHPMAVSVSLSPKGEQFATGTWKGTNIVVWSTATYRPVKELTVKGNASCLFSPDGKWLVTGSEEEYRFWSVDSWKPSLSLSRDQPGDIPGRLAFSPDGRTLAILWGRQSGIRLVSVPGGQELATLDTGQPLGFSGDGRFLATTGEDSRSVFVWDLQLIRRRLTELQLNW